MPGLLSNLFDPGEDTGSHAESNETTVSTNTDTDLAIDQEIGLNLGTTYQDANGGTHSWQIENDVGIHVDAGASLAAALGTEQANAYADGIA